MKIKKFLFILIFFTSQFSFSQVENVPLNHPVFTFLKEMKVKRLIPYIFEDVPNISRFQVKALLKKVDQQKEKLSTVELELLNWHKLEFFEILDTNNTTYFWNPDRSFGETFSDVFTTDNVKFTYAYAEKNASLFFEIIGHYQYGQLFKPYINNSHLFDIGFRIRGTVFEHLGYHASLIKGGAAGSREVAEIIEPRLLHNFKWVEDAENTGNYDVVTGYVKYHTEPAEDMHISLQLGREPITAGYGYGSKLVLSGDNPLMDFFQFNFDYGIVHLSSIHASTTGIFYPNVDDRYTKYWSFNRLKFTFNYLFDIGIGQSVVYADRGIELAYLTPVGFYTFIEHSTQNRDNANIYFDIQTGFIDNLEFQATFFMDENILSNLQDLDKYTNKTAYQFGAFWYKAFTLNNLALILEYTRIRPFVYSHFNIKNTYTAWETNLGQPIGPNSDEIFTKLTYNFSPKIRLAIEYRHIRRGENVYDDEGNLIKNVGGDVFKSHGFNPEDETAKFLDGIRIDNDIVEVGLRLEPVRDFIFDVVYNYNIENNLTEGMKSYLSYGYMRFSFQL
jgi:hypothetical protein